MNPTAFSIFGLEIKWYAILISLGIAIAMYFITKIAKEQGFEEDHAFDWLMWGIPLGIVGARLWYVLFNLEYYDGFLKVINVREGGLAIHGGILVGAAVLIVVCRLHRMNVWKFGDIIVPFLALAQGIGRWGNFINQEAHGGPTDLPWGIMIDGVKVHPTFLYESVWNVAIFLLLIWLMKRKRFDGQLMGLYFMLYGVGRFWIEGLRTDSLMLGSLRVAQLISVAFIVAGAAILAWRRGGGTGSAYRTERPKNQG